MTPQPDKLFQDKLENFQLQLPDDAWSKVEAGLARPAKNRWWMMAAGIGLVIAASFFVWKNNSNENQILVNQNHTEKTEIPSVKKPVLAEKENVPVTINKHDEIIASSERKPVLQKNKQPSVVLITNDLKNETA
jgi:hypothetical protein